jgi:uncharacterized protein YecA (UPF0149 family)
MARDPIANRFTMRQKADKLDDLSKRARGKDDVEAEKELVDKTDKVEPIKADAAPQRNAPCPCGSGKKFKKCCGAK